MNRTAKVKAWMKSHKDEIEATAIVGAMIGVYVGFVALSIKMEKQQQQDAENTRQQLVDAVNAGKTILPNQDGSFWILDPK